MGWKFVRVLLSENIDFRAAGEFAYSGEQIWRDKYGRGDGGRSGDKTEPIDCLWGLG